ncbi:hypothetical protein HHI36_001932 [Cryptolaemus montrouzieri]|uniref:Uncharacterized protein n=1 Tax=Cryptolaemus montrouzieri TaxID=559131 RepID=A0ABD2P920_9CUCU
MYSYFVDGVELSRVDCIRDLGITLDVQLNFKEHMRIITSKAYRMLGFIVRHSVGFSADTFKLLYCSLVRSTLEYGTCICSPFYSCDIDCLEKVQRKFLTYLYFRCYRRTVDLAILRITYSLNHLLMRGKFFDSCFFFKIVNGSVCCPDLFKLIDFNLPLGITRHTLYSVQNFTGTIMARIHIYIARCLWSMILVLVLNCSVFHFLVSRPILDYYLLEINNHINKCFNLV